MPYDAACLYDLGQKEGLLTSIQNLIESFIAPSKPLIMDLGFYFSGFGILEAFPGGCPDNDSLERWRRLAAEVKLSQPRSLECLGGDQGFGLVPYLGVPIIRILLFRVLY